MENKKLVKVSKYLSRHLRHDPERLGITLDSAGWTDVAALLSACASRQMPITRAELEQVVAENDKKRFAFSPDGKRIRASQGHSVAVELEYEPITPPAILYHGTGAGSVPAIFAGGLQKMARHHVHLTDSTDTAVKVGGRHGKPVVLAVNADAMHRAGHTFYRSENGVYLTDDVPPEYLSLAEND